MRLCVPAALVILAASTVHADVYMHNPRGSNDRNCERNVNRDNGNRLFDSQNNAQGGYACPRAVGGPEIQRYVPSEDRVFGNTLSGQQFWEKMYYYVGSKLPIEWTAQHGCGGNKKTNCQIIIQYACEDTLDPLLEFTAPLGANDRWIGAPRDGIPRDSNDAATDTIPTDRANGIANTEANRRFGMHENSDYYRNCTQRSRNRGLFAADQNINRNDARGTRQNPNGNRNGLECPEERDYYPYWHPSPWIDIAVLHDFDNGTAVTQAWCDYYRNNSQNSPTATPGECIANPTSAQETPDQVANRKNNGQWYNNRRLCEDAGHTWVTRRLGLNAGHPLLSALSPPDCQLGAFGRINHLGNARATIYDNAADANNIPHDLNAARYVWTVPNHLNENCALRLRYNVSTSDYQPWMFDPNNPAGTPGLPAGTPGANATLNGRTNSPVTQDPYVYLSKADDQFLSLAVNTNQYGRTFQDRSYVFAIRAPPPAVAAGMSAGKKLYNLNVRGKRGNIVQTFPAVEYDFIPDNLNVEQGHYIHFQWTGSDYNPRRGCNDAEGGPPDPNTATAANDNSRADRSNIVPIDVFADNYPDLTMFPQIIAKTKTDVTARPATTAAGSMFDSTDVLMKMAFIKQDRFLSPTAPCLTQTELDQLNGNNRENHPRNCAKLNAAFHPYFDGGVLPMNKTGTYPYFSSRNNNFSNRDQTGRVCIYGSAAAVGTCTGSSAAAPAAAAGKAVIPAGPTPDPVAPLSRETFAFNTQENDALGDGEKAPCEGMNYSLVQLSEGAAAGLVIGMIILGAGLMLAAQFGIRWYLNRPKGVKELCMGPDFTSHAKMDPDAPPAPARTVARSWGRATKNPAPAAAAAAAAAAGGASGAGPDGARGLPPPPPAKPTGRALPPPPNPRPQPPSVDDLTQGATNPFRV